MKKLSYLILITLVSTSLFACGGSKQESDSIDNPSDISSDADSDVNTESNNVSSSSSNENSSGYLYEDEYYEGELTTDDILAASGQYIDSYKIMNIPQGTIVEAYAEGINLDDPDNSIDPYLKIYPDLDGVVGEQLDFDDDSGELDSAYIRTVATEDCNILILVTSYEAGDTGTYKLWLNWRSPDATSETNVLYNPDESSSDSSSTSSADDDECSWDSDCGSCEACRDGQCYYSYSFLDSSC